MKKIYILLSLCLFATIVFAQPSNDPMVLIAGGKFEMGCASSEDCEEDERLHTVSLSGFYISKYELSFDEYDTFCKLTNRRLKSDAGWGRGLNPALGISWYEAILYCNWRSEFEGFTPCYTIDSSQFMLTSKGIYIQKPWAVTCDFLADGYRLPTEAEWEYAARERGKDIERGTGRNIIRNCSIDHTRMTHGELADLKLSEYEKTVAVNALDSNALGLYNTGGNVREWCWDWMGEYPEAYTHNPTGPELGIYRIGRGGSLLSCVTPPNRLADRTYASPNDGFRLFGLRLARSLPSASTSTGMHRLRGGSFRMGCTSTPAGMDCPPNERITHEVNLLDYYIGTHEVSFEQYDAFCNATHKLKPHDEGWGRGKRPVINIDWYDAIEYCNWRSKQEGLAPCYSIDKTQKDPNNRYGYDEKKWIVECDFLADGYRLPTEAEWEFAARGGGLPHVYAHGRDSLREEEINILAPALDSLGKTVEVDAFIPSPLGLYNMGGNVKEWCWDWLTYYGSKAMTNPTGWPKGHRRQVRGGSWNTSSPSARVSARNSHPPSFQRSDVGFRLARTASVGWR